MDDRTKNTVEGLLGDQISDTLRAGVSEESIRAEEVDVIAARLVRDLSARLGDVASTPDRTAELEDGLTDQIRVALRAHACDVSRRIAGRYAARVAAVVAGIEIGLMAVGIEAETVPVAGPDPEASS